LQQFDHGVFTFADDRRVDRALVQALVGIKRKLRPADEDLHSRRGGAQTPGERGHERPVERRRREAGQRCARADDAGDLFVNGQVERVRIDDRRAESRVARRRREVGQAQRRVNARHVGLAQERVRAAAIVHANEGDRRRLHRAPRPRERPRSRSAARLAAMSINDSG
jgi:hypothetical protein